jgi:hypothetical protein
MYSWGTTKLKVVPESYNPPHAVRKRTVIDLIPGADISTPASIIQDGGRDRKQATLSGFTTSLAEYNLLYDDYLSSTVRTFIGPADETLNAMIWELSPAQRIFADKYEYNITLMEV